MKNDAPGWLLFSDAAFSTLVRMSLVASLAIALVLVLRSPLRRALGAGAAYALWSLLPIALLASLLPSKTLLRVDREISAGSQPAVPDGSAMARMGRSSSPTPSQPLDPAPSLIVFWMAGVLASTARQLGRQRRFVRDLGRLTPIASGTWRAQAASADCPVLVGAWRPRIVLPADFERRYTPNEQQLILLHEQRHRRRGDAQINALAAGLRCAFWFNPLIHYAATRFRFDQEMSCDAAVLAHVPQARRTYAEALLKTQMAGCGLPVGCHWQFFPPQSSIHPLKERLVMLKQPTPRFARRALGSCLVGMLAATSAYAAWATQPPRLVRADAASSVASGSTPAAPSQDTPVSLRRWHAPIYPQAFIDSGVEGVIGVRAQVDAFGNVSDARIEFSDPPRMSALHGNALASMLASTFAPAKVGGKAVAVSTLVPIRFRIEGHPDWPMPPLPADALPGDYVVFDAPSAAFSTATETRPKALDVGWPDYPDDAVRVRSSGKIVVKVHIDEKGNPRSAVIDTMDPVDLGENFAAPSIATAMQARYTPGTRNGQPVAGDLRQQFSFRNDAVASD